MMFRSNKGFRESLVWKALRQLAVAWPTLKMATMAIFNRLLGPWTGMLGGVFQRRRLTGQAFRAENREMLSLRVAFCSPSAGW